MNDLQRRAGDDPWSLELAERRDLLTAMRHAQEAWLPLLIELVEPPSPGEDFPAFLLETSTFSQLREAIACQIEDHQQPLALDTATADTLQRFVDLFRDYMVELDQHQHAYP